MLPLPSPPPTPPEPASAPSLDMFPDVPFADDTLENCPNTFDRWKIRLDRYSTYVDKPLKTVQIDDTGFVIEKLHIFHQTFQFQN